LVGGAVEGISMDGIIYIENFLANHNSIFNYLIDNVAWDERMTARKTASYGVAYNYSQMCYPFQPMLPELSKICSGLIAVLDFEPNNCLINYYSDGQSKMGFHSDQIDILEKDTGIAIISLGQTRSLKFRNIKNNDETFDYALPSGSLLYMTQNIQKEWEHAIPKSDVESGRMSLTWRKIIS
jgi:alkylated DNA repair dioxygenase AlkB